MLIFLYGEDDFGSSEKLRQIKENFVKNNSEAISVVFDLAENGENFNQIKNTVNAGGLFSGRKIIVVKNIFVSLKAEEQVNWLEFLKEKKELSDSKNSEIIFVFWEKGTPRKNNKLFKFLLANSKKEEFNKLQGERLRSWIEEKFSKNKLKVSVKATEKLMAYTEGNSWKINNEIKKLVSYKKEGGSVEEDDMEKMVGFGAEANIFETIEALSLGNKKRALRLLHNQLQQGDDPFYILSMYVYQFRNLLKIADFYFQGISNQYEIAKLAKVHPFVAQKGIQQVKNFNLPHLKNIYRQLEKIDRQAKTGQADLKLLLDMFVTKV